MSRILIKVLIVFLLLIGIKGIAQTPTVTTRFANPVYNTAAQTYIVDVEFQCDTPNEQLYIMNVRFYYDDSVLEFDSFGEFAEGYGPIVPNPPSVSTFPASYSYKWGFTGAPEYVNGAIQKLYASSVYLSTTDWTKLFNITFHVDDTTAMNGDFCPSIVWDLAEDPSSGGFLYGSGVVITVTPPLPSGPATENVEQFNWEYDYIPGEPFGYPVEVNCVSARVAPTTRILSAMCNNYGYITFPVVVDNFVDINSFTLTLDYDQAVLEYCCAVPNIAVADNFDTTTFYPGRIQMGSFGFNASLADGSVLFHATFKYNGGTCGITWNNGETTCVYTDANNGLPLPDLPTAEFYVEGSVAAGFFHWSGNVSSNWQDAANWQNGLVPGSFDNVFIHSSPLPSHYPEYTGDFTLGSQCSDLTLNGGAEFYIAGDLTIDPGRSLTLADTGKLTLAGDWINSGTFNPGLGEVVFNGSGDGNIGGGTPPESVISGFGLDTFNSGYTSVSGGMVGPVGDEAHMNVDIGFTFNYLGVDYSQARISTNGWISLNLTGDIPLSNQNAYLFSAMGPSTVLAPWWDDLRVESGASIYYITEGTAPNRIFTVEWRQIGAYRYNQNTRMNFQVKLYETSNIIEFYYGSVTGTHHNPRESASIGIKDAVGGPGHFLEPTDGTTHLMTGCLVSDNEWPAVNYRFTPPASIDTQTFHQLSVSKDNGELRITQNVVVTGVD